MIRFPINCLCNFIIFSFQHHSRCLVRCYYYLAWSRVPFTVSYYDIRNQFANYEYNSLIIIDIYIFFTSIIRVIYKLSGSEHYEASFVYHKTISIGKYNTTAGIITLAKFIAAEKKTKTILKQYQFSAAGLDTESTIFFTPLSKWETFADSHRTNPYFYIAQDAGFYFYYLTIAPFTVLTLIIPQELFEYKQVKIIKLIQNVFVQQNGYLGVSMFFAGIFAPK